MGKEKEVLAKTYNALLGEYVSDKIDLYRFLTESTAAYLVWWKVQYPNLKSLNQFLDRQDEYIKGLAGLDGNSRRDCGECFDHMVIGQNGQSAVLQIVMEPLINSSGFQQETPEEQSLRLHEASNHFLGDIHGSSNVKVYDVRKLHDVSRFERWDELRDLIAQDGPDGLFLGYSAYVEIAGARVHAPIIKHKTLEPLVLKHIDDPRWLDHVGQFRFNELLGKPLPQGGAAEKIFRYTHAAFRRKTAKKGLRNELLSDEFSYLLGIAISKGVDDDVREAVIDAMMGKKEMQTIPLRAAGRAIDQYNQSVKSREPADDKDSISWGYSQGNINKPVSDVDEIDPIEIEQEVVPDYIPANQEQIVIIDAWLTRMKETKYAEIIQVRQDNPGITQTELAKILRMDRKTLRSREKELKEIYDREVGVDPKENPETIYGDTVID